MKNKQNNSSPCRNDTQQNEAQHGGASLSLVGRLRQGIEGQGRPSPPAQLSLNPSSELEPSRENQTNMKAAPSSAGPAGAGGESRSGLCHARPQGQSGDISWIRKYGPEPVTAGNTRLEPGQLGHQGSAWEAARMAGIKAPRNWGLPWP